MSRRVSLAIFVALAWLTSPPSTVATSITCLATGNGEATRLDKDDDDGSSGSSGDGDRCAERADAACLSDTDCPAETGALCLCDTACGRLACIRPNKGCPELPDPPNGQVHVTGRHFTDHAVYTCNDGHQLYGAEKIVCQANGKWSDVEPICRTGLSATSSRYYCGPPRDIANAKHNGSLEQQYYSLDSSLTYTCQRGYKRTGFDEAQCFFFNNSARWFGPDLTCDPIDCGPPTAIVNGAQRGDCTTYRCQMEYACVPGFRLVGKRDRYCQADGTWTPSELPSCAAVQCPIPNSPVNGKAYFTTVAYQSVVRYECHYGYMISLNRSTTRTCGQDRQWTGEEPECVEIDCGSPGFLANGWLEGTQTNLHAVITFHCNPDMIFDGRSQRTTCQADGRWSHALPRCQAPCALPSIANGQLTLPMGNGASGQSAPPGRRQLQRRTGLMYARRPVGGVGDLVSRTEPVVVPHATKLGVACNDRYELIVPSKEAALRFDDDDDAEGGKVFASDITVDAVVDHAHYKRTNASTFYCVNGTFAGLTDCAPASCKTSPTTPRNGMALVASSEHGSIAVLRCADGYRLTGKSVAVCSHGQWSDTSATTCQLIFCPFPGYIDGGKVLLVGNMGLYDYRPYVRKVENNRQIMFECNRGFKLEGGPPGATCVDGKWSPSTLPRCVEQHHPTTARWQF